MSGDNKPVASLTLGAMGVVYGDIGTSPLYAFKEVLPRRSWPDPAAPEIFGVLSLIFWSVMLVVSLKYVIVHDARRQSRRRRQAGAAGTGDAKSPATVAFSALLAMLGIFAAALFYGDSMLTPAISVLSAVEGLDLVAPALGDYVIPLTLAIICVLFLIQRNGTASVGAFFGPVMSVWFATLAGLGVWHIAQAPEILAGAQSNARGAPVSAAPAGSLHRAGLGGTVAHRGRGPVRGHGAFRQTSDPHRVDRVRVAGTGAELFRAGRAGVAGPGADGQSAVPDGPCTPRCCR